MTRKKWIVLALLALTQFLVVLDSAIVNVALPDIKQSLGFSDETLQWVLTSYVLTFGGFLLLGGRVADLYGRRLVLSVGLTGFTLTSLMIGLSQSAEVFVGLRALQGLSAAFMSPVAMSILLAVFSEGKERSRALSVWTIVAAGGAAAGLLLGGVITQTLGWHWNFFVNVPIGILALIGILKYIPAHEKEETNKTLDLPGAFLVTGGMMALVYAVGEIPMRGLFNPLVIWSFIGAIIALVLFIINESRVKHPLMPLSIFKIRNVVGGNIIIIPAIASMFGSFYFMSLYFQNILKYSPIMAGLSFLIFPLIIGIVSWNAPKIVNKIGLKNTLIAGTTLPIIGMALLTFIPLELNYWINVLPSFVLIPAGMGMFFLAVILAATSGVPARESGLVSGMVNTSQQLGGALGIAILSTIAVLIQNGSHDPRVVLSSFHAAFFAATLLMLVSLVVSMFVIKVDQPRNQKA